MLNRRQRMLGDIDLTQCVGIEIGALHSPIVSRTEGRILYADYAPTEELRRTFKHPGVDPATLVDVDIVWGKQPLRDLIAEPVDYVVASHVIEHFPDLIGWFLELHTVLKPDGILGLAIPDRRYTFDVYRRESSLAEIVEAYLLGYRRPSIRQLFEACAFSKVDHQGDVHLPPHRPGDDLPAEVADRIGEVFNRMQQEVAQTSPYIDVHCWVFTPASFLGIVQALARLGCFPFEIAGFHPTETGSIEFQVSLRSTRSDGEAIASINAVREQLMRDDTADNDPPITALREHIAEQERLNGELSTTLDMIKKSRSWRLTAPLRSARRWMRDRYPHPR